MQGSLICIELDANAKLGRVIIKGDPHKRSPNGELLFGILERNNLIVCNGTNLCKGLLSRTRTTVVGGVEISIIDFLTEIMVDENKKYPVESLR